jgi:hypothetical protein
MVMRLARKACLVVALAAGVTAATASDLADFNAAMETVEARNRTAIGELQADDPALAARSLDQLRADWQKLTERFGGHPPAAFKSDRAYGIAMTDIGARLITADLMIKTGHPAVARAALQALRDDLYQLRKSAGIVVLSDCIRDSGTLLKALTNYDPDKLDWDNAQIRADIAAKGAGYDHALAGCDALAGASLRKQDNFRHLIDGARQAVALIEKAIATRDGKLLQEIFTRLRQTDKMLQARFG